MQDAEDCTVIPYHRMFTDPLEGNVKNCNKPYIYMDFVRRSMVTEATRQGNH